jgi:NADH-quinone oxidoreductase subunit C
VTAHVFDLVQERLAPLVGKAATAHGVLVLEVSAADIPRVAQQLKSDFLFDLFLDVTAVDWLGEEPRFELVYHFYSTQHKVRVRIKARVTEAEPVVDSLTPLYGSAHFMERECHEMYGIRFRGNPDLRPVLLYEGFEGHPLRKDYPILREQPLVDYRK